MIINHSSTNNDIQNVSHNSAITKQPLLTSGDIKNIVYFSRAMFPVGETVEPHKHTDMTEVFYIESGRAKFIVNQQPHILETGSCVTIEPNELHEVINIGENELILVYFGVLTP
ncbi:cupin domain-containing protein [Algibacillus agarilyticus]|uniref:cupin domain-containing protein n=1 Tax=Algibacillus agarilyticus TaxID=2234133 RepID=UPI000DCFF98D|nr:cupin domain-containing protein [Algibacillus agarilyticus]